jgi:hypothetical protein
MEFTLKAEDPEENANTSTEKSVTPRINLEFPDANNATSLIKKATVNPVIDILVNPVAKAVESTEKSEIEEVQEVEEVEEAQVIAPADRMIGPRDVSDFTDEG